MAEEDAEKAFFQAQAMNANMVDYSTVEGQAPDNSDSDDYDPSNTLQDQYSASLSDSKQSANLPSNPASYDPSSPNEAPLPQDPTPGHQADRQSPPPDQSQPPSGAPAQQNTKTIGGFVVDDEDEDDKGDTDYEPPAVLGAEGADAARQQPLSGNADQATSTPDVSLNEPAQDSASSKNVSNSSYSPASKNAAPGQSVYGSQALQAENGQESAAPTPTPDPSPTSRGRLPHDRVGILEDRIQEDPRGDTAAWLELISEHRSRNRIDNARETYERFLKVFPLAVSMPSPSKERKAYENRPSNGWRMRPWSPRSVNCTGSSRFSTERS
jgi:cleavage stimulation factor subunit 3